MVKNQSNKTNNGYIALSMVLLLTVVTLAIATTVSYLSIGEGQSGLADQLGESTLNLAEECTEDLLLRVRSDGIFAAVTTSTTFTEPEGTCVATKSGNTWTITNTLPNTYTRSIQITFNQDADGITFTPGITSSHWKEN